MIGIEFANDQERSQKVRVGPAGEPILEKSDPNLHFRSKPYPRQAIMDQSLPLDCGAMVRQDPTDACRHFLSVDI